MPAEGSASIHFRLALDLSLKTSFNSKDMKYPNILIEKIQPWSSLCMRLISCSLLFPFRSQHIFFLRSLVLRRSASMIVDRNGF